MKEIINGTRITRKELITMIVGGMTYDEIEKEYGIKKERLFRIMKGFGALKGIGSFTREDRAKDRFD